MKPHFPEGGAAAGLSLANNDFIAERKENIEEILPDFRIKIIDATADEQGYPASGIHVAEEFVTVSEGNLGRGRNIPIVPDPL